MFIAVVIAFFGFTTAVVNAYYGGICLNALGFKGAPVKVFYALASVFGIVGAIGALNTVWATFDFFFGVCVLCNLVIIFVMRDKIVLLVRDYEERLLTPSWGATACRCGRTPGPYGKTGRCIVPAGRHQNFITFLPAGSPHIPRKKL